MFQMPALTKVACTLIIFGAMLAATHVVIGSISTAIFMLAVCVMALAWSIAINL
jgi:hypothetical protein